MDRLAPPVDALTTPPRPRLQTRALWREAVEVALLIVAVVTLVNLTTARFIVDGDSMQPNLATGQFVLINRLNYLLWEPQRGDVIVLASPEQQHEDLIKRVIGLPGETVRVHNQQVWIDGLALDEPYLAAPPSYTGEWQLDPGEYFVLGDNRNNSRDSHSFGPVNRAAIVGQAWLVYWPPTAWGIIPQHEYATLPDAAIGSNTTHSFAALPPAQHIARATQPSSSRRP